MCVRSAFLSGVGRCLCTSVWNLLSNLHTSKEFLNRKWVLLEEEKENFSLTVLGNVVKIGNVQYKKQPE